MDVRGDVLALEVHGLDLATEGLGERQSGRDGVNGVDLGGALEQRPLDAAELETVSSAPPFWSRLYSPQ